VIQTVPAAASVHGSETASRRRRSHFAPPDDSATPFLCERSFPEHRFFLCDCVAPKHDGGLGVLESPFLSDSWLLTLAPVDGTVRNACHLHCTFLTDLRLSRTDPTAGPRTVRSRTIHPPANTPPLLVCPEMLGTRLVGTSAEAPFQPLEGWDFNAVINAPFLFLTPRPDPPVGHGPSAPAGCRPLTARCASLHPRTFKKSVRI
jgi:hypothetical protein